MYTELHNHSFYSLLDGLNSPREQAERALALGHGAVAITDHGTNTGHREMQVACAELGIKPVLGSEMYISPTDRFTRKSKKKSEQTTQAYNHIIVHAKSQTGLRNLQTMSAEAWETGFYYKPRIDWELLNEYGDDCIVLSGCMNGLVAKAIERGEQDEAQRLMRQFVDRFGADFYVELQPHNPIELNKPLAEIAAKFGTRVVVTNDCHYVNPADRDLEDMFLILGTSPKASGKRYDQVSHLPIMEMLEELWPDRTMSFAELDLYMKSESDVYDALVATGMPAAIAREAVESTAEIVAKVGDYEHYEGLDLLPKLDLDVSSSDTLRERTMQGLRKLGLTGQEYIERAEHELQVIADLNFDTYFLIVADVMDDAAELDVLVGPGRGSSAGSLVCYALGITDVDPIEHKLLFFRFLDPERGDWPDIDMDFPDDRRAEIIDRVRNRYGHVANISTYGYFKDKSSIKAAARALGVPYGQVEVMAKSIETIEDYRLLAKDSTTAVGRFHAKYPLVLKYAERLRGRVQSAGLHPAGIVVSEEPISNYVAVEHRTDEKTKERFAAIVADMHGAEEIGLIKLDFLGLKALSVIARAAKWAGVKVPRTYTDQAVLDEYVRGNTVGVFQAEASPYTRLLSTMQDSTFTFDDLVASNALVRPGAMNTVGKPYLRRRSGLEEVSFDNERMREITEETYGVVIYQEQLMQAAMAFGAFTQAEANKLRKIVGKKLDAAEFKPYEEKWMANASIELGRERAVELWGDFQAHAGYSFNKSHAVAYSMLSYWSMWLKYYYPVEFIASSLAGEEKVTDNPKWSKLLLETRRLDIPVELPHVNSSDIKPIPREGRIALGLANAKYVGEKAAAKIIDARPFESYEHLQEVSQRRGSGISSRVLDSLHKVNGTKFSDSAAVDASEHLYDVLGIPSFDALEHKHPERISPLDEFVEQGAFVVQAFVQKVKRGKGWSQISLLDETGMVTVFHEEHTEIVQGKMYTMLIANNTIVEWLKPGKTVFGRWLAADRLPGELLLEFSARQTKAGKTMATAVFSDEHFQLSSGLIFPAQYSKLQRSLKAGLLISPVYRQLDDGANMVVTLKGE